MSHSLQLSRVLSVLCFAFLSLAGVASAAAQEAPAPGSVEVVKYDCTYLDTVMLVEAFDEAQCLPGAATFTFYLVGDGTADYRQMTVTSDGTGMIGLPPGSYEMVEETSQTTFNIEVTSGGTTRLLIGAPGTIPAPIEEIGTVRLANFSCSYLDEVMLVESIDESACTPLPTTFSFYLVGDGTDDYEQATVGADGFGMIELHAGTYVMVEEGSQATYTIEVIAGDAVAYAIGHPTAVVQPTTPAPTVVPTAPAPTAVPPKPSSPVKTLPTTGSGAESELSAFTLAAVAGGALAGAGALRSRRSA